MHDLIVITGQTATGKTALGLKYARELHGEIVNTDSRHVYKFLDIVTGKDVREYGTTPVHLLDIVTPDQPFSSHDFVTLAIPLIKDIQKRGKTPILVGGTYLYIKHLLYGQSIKVQPNPLLRMSLEKLSVEELQKKLYRLDKKLFESMNNSDKNNPRRLIRKIEILSSASTSGAARRNSHEVEIEKQPLTNLYKIQIIGLKHKNPASARKVIAQRVEKRLKQGSIEETKKLLSMGYKSIDPGLQTIGYKQIIQYLDGKLAKNQLIEDWINKEVQYAKRQLTFIKADRSVEWRPA